MSVSQSQAPPSQQSLYEARLRPDPVYGLGMRLEKREHDILVASFKVRRKGRNALLLLQPKQMDE